MQTITTYDKCLLADLLTNRQYAEALQYIDSLNVRKNGDLSREDIAHLYFAQGQCFYRLGNYRKAAVKLKLSIKIADTLNDNSFYARQKATLGQIYLEMGRLDEALVEFNESHAFFRRSGDTERAFLATEMIALIHFQKGNYTYACELNELILTQAKRLELSDHVRLSGFNLCRVLILTGDLKRVHELLDSIADDCTDSLSLTWLESLRGMLSVRLLDDAGAGEHLGNAIARAKECHYRRDEVVCLEYLALNEFYHGRYNGAINYCERILATPEVTPSAVAQTLWLLTEVYVAENKLTLAAETGTKAEQAITQVKEWAELGCLHRALALLADKRGDAKSASDHFDKSIDILARHGARYELAVTYLAAGAAGCLEAEMKKERLQQAKTLFTQMDVPKRVEQVEVALARLTGAKAPRKSVRSDKIRIEDPDIITQNPAMMRILSDAAKFAQTNMNILITGETGTGKDLLAKRIHCLSRRSGGPFRNENMSRFPRELVDSELFGYEKGSHSRAENGTPGLIELADGGTFCLNEVAELPLEMQVRLLQVIEEGTVRRVGGGVPRPVDVRFITMTNCDLEKRVEARLFRHDLLFRLRGGHLHIPPLRERMDDLALLVQYFLKQMEFADYTPEQAALIVQKSGCDRYHWPGNVRDLLNVLERAVTLAPSSNVMGLLNTLSDVMERLPGSVSEVADKEELVAALNRCGGNQTRAAEDLGVSRTTLRYRMQRHGLL